MSKTTDLNQNPGCLGGLLRLFGGKPNIEKYQTPVEAGLPFDAEPELLPYRVRDDFLSPAEHCFYLVLKGMMGGYLTICPKVSLGDIFFVARPNENISAYNRINRKHVDFLLCEPKTMKPIFGIELDDSSHARPEREERDLFVERVFDAAGLMLVRVPVQASYNTSELGAQFRQALLGGNAPTADARQAVQDEDSGPVGATDLEHQNQAPFCPKCGDRMVLRVARNGQKAGESFYGCSNYPRCRALIPVSEWERERAANTEPLEKSGGQS